jgi:hypothetical protein
VAVRFWLQDGRAMACDDWMKASPIVVEEAPDLAGDLAAAPL